MAHSFVVSDFNAEPLARLLRNRLGVEVEVGPYNQVFQALGNEAARGNLGLVWVRAESVLPSFAKALELAPVDHEACLDEVDGFADFVLRFAARFAHCLLASFVLPPGRRGYGVLDWKPGLGLSHLIARMNVRLAERLAAASNIRLLDAARWLSSAPKPFSARMWYAAKVPYSAAVLEAAASDVAVATAALAGKSRRLVIVDLDNTLWGGVIGETGWQGIRLGGHDHLGEAFIAFQRALKALANRGIQIGLVSKNDEATALEAFENHPEMVLRTSDLAGWRINWSDKAANVAALAEELNLGLGSAVFIDDNAHERERVKSALPEVLVPDWPGDPCLYSETLLVLDCFDTAVVSEEDRQRTSMYVADRVRRDSRTTMPSVADWLKGLNTRVLIESVSPANIARVGQLFNKTNQLNMTTRRLSEREILEWGKTPARTMLCVSVSDRFGDMGLCGVLGIASSNGRAEITDYLLSCRVMGRGVEETMFHLAAAEAVRLGARHLEARFLPTERNRPCLQVLRESLLVETEPLLFTWDLSQPYPAPDFVEALVHVGERC